MRKSGRTSAPPPACALLAVALFLVPVTSSMGAGAAGETWHAITGQGPDPCMGEEEREEAGAARLVISPAHALVRIDETAEFQALFVDDAGVAREVGAKWQAESGGFGDGGRYLPAALGVWTLRADWGSHAATATAEVVPGKVSVIDITPREATIFEGSTASVLIEAGDSGGNPPQSLSISWDEPSGIEIERRPGGELILDIRAERAGRYDIGILAGDGNRTVRGSFLLVVASTDYLPLAVGLGLLIVAVAVLAARLRPRAPTP